MFVSIEMTGQGVEFEQKFNYRRPMYAILEYLWEIEIHRDAIKVRYTIVTEIQMFVQKPGILCTCTHVHLTEIFSFTLNNYNIPFLLAS